MMIARAARFGKRRAAVAALGRRGLRTTGSLREHRDPATRDDSFQEEIEYVAWEEAGHRLLENPIYNKSTAFDEEERKALGLRGLLPPHIETLEQQLDRAYASYSVKTTDLEKHIMLRQLQDTNEVMFYALLSRHISEMMPIIYTPTVGQAAIQFSQIWRRPRGIFISYPLRAQMRDMFKNLIARGHTGAPVDVDTRLRVNTIVVTDGSRILGLGDLGANGQSIPIGKASLYTAIGGIPGPETLPVFLDVGTDNEAILNQPSYIGWRSKRLRGKEYFDFVDQFVSCVKEFFPGALLQWEDFDIQSASPILKKYRNELCTFNDDIQGTATIVLATLLSACQQTQSPLKNRNIVMVGSGSAGCGIAEMIKMAMMQEGLTEEEAKKQIFMVDRYGVVHSGQEGLLPFQQELAQDQERLADWEGGKDGNFSLVDTIKNAKPSVMIGVTGMPGLFNEEVVSAISETCDRPIIFPLSNPTERAEGKPADIMAWSNNRAVVATGTMFEPTEVVVSKTKYTQTTKRFVHSMANNSWIFPAVGLACKVVGATRVTDGMLMGAARALAECSPGRDGDQDAPLLPPHEELKTVTRYIAVRVCQEAIREGKTTRNDEDDDGDRLLDVVERTFWTPRYKRVEIDSSMWTRT
ncbi:NADP-dependent malic enzyme [Hondaea fermentalgiana]|uniref:Malic enzyme n=1 Tax=Hondaea fermentalgiana TaxID=2315210 RepID=A0A2R5GIX3_9STRA|nr:NADP-dependent malic enzyme [Hondaea fermentalgiana]|eukprot:GBG30842.1 NADP-dependent malic enzyme [Hondaea fermentalgiana]